MPQSQRRLREALAAGDFKAALAWREDDALLRALNVGISSYYASQFARSGALLDSAALLADDRITASISRDVLALVTNDMARPYQPRRTERLFVPYYGMLSYAQLGAWEDAAVEARRMVALLAQYADDQKDAERPLHATLHYLAGAVFERAGEREEAQVAYRAAHELLSIPAVPSSSRGGEDQGELVVVVERGFVAHRATGTFSIELEGDERDSLRSNRETQRRTVSRLVERIAGTSHSSPAATIHPWQALSYRSSTGGHHHRDDDDDDYNLTIAFPAVRRSSSPWGKEIGLRLLDGDTLAPLTRIAAHVDDAVEVDADRERGGIVARAALRAAAKYAVTKAIKDKKGEVAGTIANFGASLLERADVRSWHLLPQEITLLRIPMATGTHQVRLAIGDGPDTRFVDLGSVTVRHGAVTLAPIRLWRDPAP
jgi:tetratricopeptide (TPR) repeat protein